MTHLKTLGIIISLLDVTETEKAQAYYDLCKVDCDEKFMVANELNIAADKANKAAERANALVAKARVALTKLDPTACMTKGKADE